MPSLTCNLRANMRPSRHPARRGNKLVIRRSTQRRQKGGETLRGAGRGASVDFGGGRGGGDEGGEGNIFARQRGTYPGDLTSTTVGPTSGRGSVGVQQGARIPTLVPSVVPRTPSYNPSAVIRRGPTPEQQLLRTTMPFPTRPTLRKETPVPVAATLPRPPVLFCPRS